MISHETCMKLPYTISIQFSMSDLSMISNDMHMAGLNNKISSHLSIKYLGYEDEISLEKIEYILKMLRENGFGVQRKKIEIGGFRIMNSINSFFCNLLYLEVEPKEYLQTLHYEVVSILKDQINIYTNHDLVNYIPHISCGKVDDKKCLTQLNAIYQKHEKVYIEEWYITLHTSKIEYDLSIV